MGQTPSFIADLFNLTKPKVLSLLLVATFCPMILAAGGVLQPWILFWGVVGGALISGSASAINCIWDRDIDFIMERTKNRPLAAGRVSPVQALVFSIVIGVAGFAVLAYKLNMPAALVALFGHLFYVFVYTMWLKRCTPQNIVIGGAAGAVPPVVGWVAVTGQIDITAALLFLLIFLWTPPHFWALALNRNRDYRLAGVPMLPVVAGEKSTHRQMFWYAISLIPVSALLVLTNPHLGWISMTGLLALSTYFVFKVWQLMRSIKLAPKIKEKRAWEVFGFSVVYLGLFFALLVFDSVVV